MSLKQLYFIYRDRIRFNWAREKFNYMPDGPVKPFDPNKNKPAVAVLQTAASAVATADAPANANSAAPTLVDTVIAAVNAEHLPNSGTSSAPATTSASGTTSTAASAETTATVATPNNVPSANLPSDDFAWTNMKHIVVLKVDGKLGDTEVMSHFYGELKKLPHKPILSVVCSENLASIYKDILGFNQVLTVSRKPKQPEIARICEEILAKQKEIGLPGERVDLVISTEPNYRPRDFIFNYLLKPHYIAGCDVRLRSITLPLFHPEHFIYPIAVAFNAFLERGGVTPGPIIYQPLYSSKAAMQARAYLELQDDSADSANADKGYIGINPCAATAHRCLTPALTAKLIQLCLSQTKPWSVLLMLPPGKAAYQEEVLRLLTQEEQALVGSRIKLMPQESNVQLYAALISCLSGLLTVDTAAVHLACACKVPQFCVYHKSQVYEFQWAPFYSSNCAAKNARKLSLPYDDFSTMPENEVLTPATTYLKDLAQALDDEANGLAHDHHDH